MKPPRVPRSAQSPREYARWLNEEAGLPYEEACNMAGYDPSEAGRVAAIVAAVVLFSVMLAAMAWQVVL